MNFYEKEMRSMFGHTDIIQDPKFCGKLMLGKLDDDLRVKLEFVATHIAGKYNALRLTVIKRTGGAIDNGVFKFSDIIEKYRMPDHSFVDYHMWDYGGPEWYTPITATQKAAITDRVLEYVEMYQDQTQGFASPTM